LTKIAEKLPGASGAEIKAVCTESGMYALRERRVHVTQEDFEMSVAKVSLSFHPVPASLTPAHPSEGLFGRDLRFVCLNVHRRPTDGTQEKLPCDAMNDVLGSTRARTACTILLTRDSSVRRAVVGERPYAL
jgi:hypothetical protein